MKLYLSSYKFGNHPEQLTELVRNNKKVAVIMNAVDFGDKERQNNNLLIQIEKLKELGFEAKGLDLRNYFGKKDELKEYLKSIGMVWIHGGNAFILKRAFEQSDFDLLPKLKENYKLGIINNGTAITIPYFKKENNFDEFFPTFINSSEISIEKPDSRIYLLALEQMNLKSEECIFIDDTMENILGAEKIGMKGVLFTDYQKLVADLKSLELLI